MFNRNLRNGLVVFYYFLMAMPNTSCVSYDVTQAKEAGIAKQSQLGMIDQPLTNPFNSKIFVQTVLEFAVKQSVPPTGSEIERLFISKAAVSTCPDHDCLRAYYRFEYGVANIFFSDYHSIKDEKIWTGQLNILRRLPEQSKGEQASSLTLSSVNDLIAKHGFKKTIRPSPHMPVNRLYYEFPYGVLRITFESADLERAEISGMEIIWRFDSPPK